MTDLERAQLKLQCYHSIECNDRNQRLPRAQELFAWVSDEKPADPAPAAAPAPAWMPDPPPLYDEHAAAPSPGPSPGGVGFPGV